MNILWMNENRLSVHRLKKWNRCQYLYEYIFDMTICVRSSTHLQLKYAIENLKSVNNNWNDVVPKKTATAVTNKNAKSSDDH